jgi:alkanesulfonate monooxygenase SsuD/methylene tetrahydromethanopterin reductase-like flavin-dependent oxidoreductase (luciferase family)
VHFGLTLPIFNLLADPMMLAELGADAEAAGWDAVFLWDHVYYRPPAAAVTDPWIAMAAMATRTSRIKIGPMVTPLARRRPQVVARQLVALDYLSGGRVIFGVGLGLDSSGGEFSRFGEETDDKRRAEIFDEGLALMGDLLSGREVDHAGPHFIADKVQFLPRPVNGRVPIWVAARWPNRRPLRRAANHDGVFIIDIDRPTDLEGVLENIEEARAGGLSGFEVVVQGDPSRGCDGWQEAGATWWLAEFDPFTAGPEDVRRVIASGPPSVTSSTARTH